MKCNYFIVIVFLSIQVHSYEAIILFYKIGLRNEAIGRRNCYVLENVSLQVYLGDYNLEAFTRY